MRAASGGAPSRTAPDRAGGKRRTDAAGVVEVRGGVRSELVDGHEQGLPAWQVAVDEMNGLVVENAGQVITGLRPVLDRAAVLAERVLVVVLRLEDGVPIVPTGS